ncbi:hypothetical protein AcidC75_12530 [Acidisoma sp. C75]
MTGDAMIDEKRARLIANLPAWPRSLGEALAAAYVGLSVSSLRSEVSAGRAPKPIRLTQKRRAWLREDLDAWLDKLAGKGAPEPVVASQDWMGAFAQFEANGATGKARGAKKRP